MARYAGIFRSCFVFGYILFAAGTLPAAPVEEAAQDSRCSVCGMFVAKYPNWLSEVRLADGSVLFFDGVKDMLVFLLNPEQYGSMEAGEAAEVWVRDYYSLDWVDGRTAYYVVGSDVYGPMGKEFIPFAAKAAAENFLLDHKGERVLSFGDITDEQVQSMRSGMKMRHGKK